MKLKLLFDSDQLIRDFKDFQAKVIRDVEKAYLVKEAKIVDNLVLFQALKYRLTGKCGSELYGHIYPHGLRSWNYIEKVNDLVTYQCPICGKVEKIQEPRDPIEVTTQKVKDERKQYRNDMVQPFRSGELSKEYVDLYPNQVKGMLKDGTITKDQVKKAKEVWKGDL